MADAVVTDASPRPLPPGPVGERITGLDGLRGLAILFVLFHHLFVFDPAGPVGERVAVVAEFASHGVDLFFALSGFLIARQLARSGTVPGFARRFWQHRLAKIVPLYLLVLLFVFVLLKPLFYLTSHQEKLGWLLSAGHNWPWYLFFASNIRNALDGRFTNPALDVSWSLAIEVQFYILAFVIARLFRPALWPRLAMAGIAVSVAFRAAEVAMGAEWIPILVLTPGRLDAFAFGVLAAMAPAGLARVPGLVTWIVLALPLFTPWSRADAWVELAGYTLVALAAGVAIERAARPVAPSPSFGILASPFLVLLGRISYSVYLIHLPLRAALRDILLPKVRVLDHPAAWIEQGAFTVGASVICIGAGWLTWRFFEEPARQAILAYGRRRAAPAAPAP
jgi:peptidoglycan/LPS O-acetylase OafA/YrhL